jgi:hypothetical protein
MRYPNAAVALWKQPSQEDLDAIPESRVAVPADPDLLTRRLCWATRWWMQLA